MGSYRVKKGDSLYAIAKANNTTVANLYKMNPTLAKRKAAGKGVIFSNTLVKVPGTAKAPSSTGSSAGKSSTGSSTRSTMKPTVKPTVRRSETDRENRRAAAAAPKGAASKTVRKSVVSRATYSDIMDLASKAGLSRSDMASLNVRSNTRKKAAPKGKKKSLYQQQIEDLMNQIKEQGMG